jgi:hypothetical protein
MAKGDVKAGRSALIGAAGEYFVMGELLRQAWLAGMTPRGASDYDIIATKGARTIRLRVKTKTADSDLFRWNAHKETGVIFRHIADTNDYCVLVDLAGAHPEYYVLPTAIVDAKLRQLSQEYLDGDPRRSRANRIRAFKLKLHGAWLANHKSWACIDLTTNNSD